jgi:hypothetical protein
VICSRNGASTRSQDLQSDRSHVVGPSGPTGRFKDGRREIGQVPRDSSCDNLTQRRKAQWRPRAIGQQQEHIAALYWEMNRCWSNFAASHSLF